MSLLIKIYLAGIILNLIVIAYHIISDYKLVSINLKGVVLFLISSWLIYPIIFIQARRF